MHSEGLSPRLGDSTLIHLQSHLVTLYPQYGKGKKLTFIEWNSTKYFKYIYYPNLNGLVRYIL